MAGKNTADRVAELVRPAIEELGLELWDVRILKEGASWYLRVYIDSENGIDINNCTDVSHAIDPIIDEADPISQAYYLEVCSPGLNRELKTDRHFEKMQGQEVLVHTVRPEENGLRDIAGVLKERNQEFVVLTTADGEISIARSNVSSVKLDDDKF